MKKLKTKFFLLITSVFLISLLTGSEALSTEYLDGKIDISGYLENFTSYRPTTQHRGHLSNSRNTFYLEMGYKLLQNPNLSLELYAVGRHFYESAFDLDHDYGNASNRRDHNRVRTEKGSDRLREVYADISSGPFQLRIGKQVATWGEADGFRMADIINPLDLTWHWTFEAWEDITIPIWMIRGWYKTPLPYDLSVEFVVIPFDFEPTKFAPAETAWWPHMMTRQFLLNMKQSRRSNSNDNFEFGVRLRAEIKGWDVTLYDFYTRNDDPIFTDNAEKLIKGVLLGGEDLFKYKRYNVVGGTFNGYIDSIKSVIRGECGYNMNQDFNVTATGGPPFDIREKDVFAYMIGFDRPTMIPYLSRWNYYRTYFISVQMFQKFIIHHTHGLIRPPDMGKDDTHTTFTLIVETGFFHDALVPNFLLAYDTSGWGFFLPSIKYKYGHHWRFILGADILWGNSRNEGMGIFKDNDAITFKVRYEF
jgi:hypothetical protein